MNATSKRILVGIAIILFGIYAAISISDAWSAADRLELDRQDLAELQQKLGEIEQVSEAPRVAALEIDSPDEIVNRINEALDKAGMPGSLLAKHTPLEAQRIGKSEFKLRRVDITLNAATTQQIVAFCDALKDESTGSVVRDLQLYEPRRRGEVETWNSQMTLTQVIFSPKSDS